MTRLVVFIFPEVFLTGASDTIMEVPVVPRTFLALAVVGFMKLEPLVNRLVAATERVLGKEWVFPLAREDVTCPVPRRLDDDEVWFGPVTEPVLRDPFRDMLLVTELLEADELDLLRFSFELVGLPVEIVPFFVAEVDI